MKRVVGAIVGVVLVAAIVVLGVLLSGARSDLSDTRQHLSAAEKSHRADRQTHDADRKVIRQQRARLLRLDPPAWSKSVAAQMYLRFVKPSNDTISAFNKIKDPSLKRCQQYSGTMSKQISTLAQRLQTGHWPKFVRPAIEKMIDRLADDVDKYVVQEESKTFDDYNAVVFSDGTTAQKVRILLGLPRAK